MIINNPNLKLQGGLKKKYNDISNDTISDQSKVSPKTTNINKGSLPAIPHTIPSCQQRITFILQDRKTLSMAVKIYIM